MSVPYFYINSMTYSSVTKVLTVRTEYSYLRGGGSFSIIGLSSSTLYYSTINSYSANDTYTFSVNLPSSTTFNMTVNFFKGLLNNYQFDAGYIMGVTGSPGNPSSVPLNYTNGGLPAFIDYAGPSSTSYETYRTINYTFKT